MTFEIKHPSDIYQRINDELGHIIQSLHSQTNEKDLNEAQADAIKQLKQHQAALREQLTKLERNAEWNTFTIAFYGETGAGKSSIIETLRILLREPSKLASQQAFRELQDKYGLSEESLQQLAQETQHVSNNLAEITQQLSVTQQEHQQRHKDALSHIEHLQTMLAERQRTESLWKKLLSWFRKTPEEIELANAEQQLANIVTAQDSTINSLLSQQAEAEKHKLDLTRQRQERESHSGELDALADGSIIGDGRSDFTRSTQRYHFELDGQKFALLDVPGIEGNEGLVLEEIEHAVQTAHAVFYVTNQPAPPQTGDEQRKGTLEKIKAHLGAQTEVWTVFNKKIVNPLALKSQPLINDDEQGSLVVLEEKMREHLGSHYREVFPLSALPAFLMSTDHFALNSQNAKRRNKILGSFSVDEMLEKSRIQEFIQMFSDQLLGDSEAKIKAANFNQAKGKVDESNEKIQHIQKIFGELAEKLERDGHSSCEQLQRSFAILKQRLKYQKEKLIDELVSATRRSVYQLIEQKISDDTLKSELLRHIELQQNQLNESLPEAIRTEVEIFQQDAQEILKRFEEYSQELASIYGKLDSTRINGNFDIKVKTDNGINPWGLVGGMVGLAAAPFTGGASLWVAGTALLTSLVSVGKALWSAVSSSYKKSQQRKATEHNLRRVSEQLIKVVQDALNEAMPEMKKTIEQLERALSAPAQQAAAKAQLLKHSTQKLDLLSRQISNAGKL